MKKAIIGGLVSILAASSLSFGSVGTAKASGSTLDDTVYQLHSRHKKQKPKKSAPVNYEEPQSSKEERIKVWYDFFTSPEKEEWLQRALERRSEYVSTIGAAAEQYNVPPDTLDALLMIESAYSKDARSSAGAVGIAQFMWSTAKLYGLVYYELPAGKYRKGRWVDNRRDPEKSIYASAHHLSDLYAEFGDWDLAIAAYNAGTNSVRRAMAYDKADNYWDLKMDSPRTRRDDARINKETYNYIPELYAAKQVLREKCADHF